MGEGQGAKDVSDKIENEDQLQGAQQKGEEEQQVSTSTVCKVTLPPPPPPPAYPLLSSPFTVQDSGC